MLPLRAKVDLGAMAMKGYLFRIPQTSSITGTSPSDCLVSYPGHSLDGRSYSSAEKQSVYSTAPADWASGSSTAYNICCFQVVNHLNIDQDHRYLTSVDVI